jgi:VIT1/CCC1 family predicted Fe2+/Mn2+ transporter
MGNREAHHNNMGWLRAAVLGADDGIVSTASLIVGVAASSAPQAHIVLSGLAGLVAGAMSMAAGEYVSVRSQADNERAEMEQERRELSTDREGERRELAAIYQQRGLEPALAAKVAEQLMAHDALGAHARDELGISERSKARPLQAAIASATSFALGGALPLLVGALAPRAMLIWLVAAASLASLVILGVLAARASGAPLARSAARVAFWGALAMSATAGVGLLFGAPGA